MIFKYNITLFVKFRAKLNKIYIKITVTFKLANKSEFTSSKSK